ncbi:mitochondrial import inner membrane translocase subunit TIM16 [Drosophila nasuta]|uniref:Mitochondrial import inner membrane translocase subunit TIM16 n=1 Tax=Drosophila albomicans TaxID=7291 RepID=A0A6P8XSC6_DROAB|nr:mitochondrial import inner membrane translocase subunit TIM16 [Drosophila albomicans]XP_060663127.1 mitochondrial import inner membrane translocase subunit TIM16 [Drosophila nasuta]
MAKHFARIIVYGAQSVGRAFIKAIRQEIEASRAAASHHQMIKNKSTGHDLTLKGMSLNEALQILNVKDLSSIEEIRGNYEHLFRANEKATGGSFYIQSKVFRAKERIDRELFNKMQEAMKEAPTETIKES